MTANQLADTCCEEGERPLRQGSQMGSGGLMRVRVATKQARATHKLRSTLATP